MATLLPASTVPTDERDMIYDTFEKVKFLGQGSYGTIYKVRHKTTGQILARKEVCYAKMDEKTRKQLTVECATLEKLSHPHVVEYHHRQHIPALQQVHIYMEYCPGGDLHGYIKNLKANGRYADEQFIWRTLAQLVDALYLCHKGQMAPDVGKEDTVIIPKAIVSKTEDAIILHRDLKPENIFLTEGNKVKLGDFGLAKLMQSRDLATTFIGTPYYMCPEICGGETYCAKSDIWSLGVVLYELCCRRPPYSGSDYEALRKNILRGGRDGLPEFYSQDLRSLIEACMNHNPNARPDIAKILRNPCVKLARYQLHVESLASNEAATLGKIAEAHQRLVESTAKLEDELKHLRSENEEQKKQITNFKETQRQIEIEWHAKATLAIQQRVDEKVSAERARLLQALEDEKTALRNEFEIELNRRMRAAELTKLEISKDVDVVMGRMSLGPSSPCANRKAPRKTARAPLTRSKTTANAMPGSPMDISPAKPTRISPPAVLQSRTAKALLSPTKQAPVFRKEPVSPTKQAPILKKEPITPAARRAPPAPRSAYRGRTLIELAQSPAKWDPESIDAPSPFMKRTTTTITEVAA